MQQIPPTLLKAGAWVLLFLAPVRASMIAVSLLVVADLVTGIWAARKRGDKITSWGLRNTVSKTIAYQIAILLSFVVERVFLDGLPVVKSVAGLIAVTELKSNLENLYTITGLNLWAQALKAIQGTKTNPEKTESRDADSQ